MIGEIHNENCLDTMSRMSNNSIDLVVTSPPYDNLRDYNDGVGQSWGESVWKPIIDELARVIKEGGVIVWVVADATIDGSETGSSFRQALHAKEQGLRLHDTMIWEKAGWTAPPQLRYGSVFEYMFVWSRGRPATFNAIKDRVNLHKKKGASSRRQADGSTKKGGETCTGKAKGIRKNIWKISACKSSKERTGHPAQMSERLAHDHIITWSNKGDIVYDPFTGSGTTCNVASKLDRRYIGSEISKEYTDIARARIAKSTGRSVSKPIDDLDLFNWGAF